MFYAIMGRDVANSSEKRRSVRTQHLARLENLKQQGRLLLAGPHPAIDSEDPGPAGFSGSLIIAEFDSLKEARSWAQADPYAETGVFEDVIVKPFKKVLP